MSKRFRKFYEKYERFVLIGLIVFVLLIFTVTSDITDWIRSLGQERFDASEIAGTFSLLPGDTTEISWGGYELARQTFARTAKLFRRGTGDRVQPSEVWTHLVLLKAAEKEGITVSNAELSRFLRVIVPPDIFNNRPRYKQWIREALRTSPRDFEEGVRDFMVADRVRKIYTQSFEVAPPATRESMVKQYAGTNTEFAKVSWVRLPAAGFLEAAEKELQSADKPEEELKAFFEKDPAVKSDRYRFRHSQRYSVELLASAHKQLDEEAMERLKNVFSKTWPKLDLSLLEPTISEMHGYFENYQDRLLAQAGTSMEAIQDDESKDDDPKDDDAKDDDPKDDPKEDPKDDDPKQEDPKDDESKQDEPKDDDPKDDDAKDDPKEDPKDDDPKQEDPKQDDPKDDEPEQDDPKDDEPEQDDPKDDEPEEEDPKDDDKEDDPKDDDPKEDDPKQDDPKDDPKQDDPKDGEPEEDELTPQQRETRWNRGFSIVKDQILRELELRSMFWHMQSLAAQDPKKSLTEIFELLQKNDDKDNPICSTEEDKGLIQYRSFTQKEDGKEVDRPLTREEIRNIEVHGEKLTHNGLQRIAKLENRDLPAVSPQPETAGGAAHMRIIARLRSVAPARRKTFDELTDEEKTDLRDDFYLPANARERASARLEALREKCESGEVALADFAEAGRSIGGTVIENDELLATWSFTRQPDKNVYWRDEYEHMRDRHFLRRAIATALGSDRAGRKYTGGKYLPIEVVTREDRKDPGAAYLVLLQERRKPDADTMPLREFDDYISVARRQKRMRERDRWTRDWPTLTKQFEMEFFGDMQKRVDEELSERRTPGR